VTAPVADPPAAPQAERRRAPARRRRAARRPGTSWAGAAFVIPYAVLALAFGIGPAIYALKLAFTDDGGNFAGLKNVKRVTKDFRFLPAIEHVGWFLAIWLVSMVVLVVGLALLVHSIGQRWLSGMLRLVYYLPGALAGASSVLLWLFMLDPTASPVNSLLRGLGYSSFAATIAPGHLPLIFAIIAFWTGAGGWVVVMYGALNNISSDIIEAARIDGANGLQLAFRIQIPLLRKWIAYMSVLSLAAGTQLFVEPTLLSQASNAVVPNDYSVNQLAYQYAFDLNDLNGSAAISVILLLVALILSAVFGARGGLFETEGSA
jgi:multiple sugar transport system permease protein